MLYVGYLFCLSVLLCFFFFFFSSRRRHTRCLSDWSSDVCSSDLLTAPRVELHQRALRGLVHRFELGQAQERRERALVVATLQCRALQAIEPRDRKSVV